MPKKSKNLGIRATPERQKELKQFALDRNTTVQALYDRAVEAYLGIGQATSAHLPGEGEHSSMTQNQAVILERLDILLEGQRHIQDGVTKVLREIAGESHQHHPMVESVDQAHTSGDDPQFGGVPVDHAKLIAENASGSGSSGPIEKNRPPKQKAPPSTRTRRRKN